MGWFIGITGRDQSLKESINSIIPGYSFKSEEESFFLIGGGPPDTIHYHDSTENEAGFIASGIGISTGENPTLFTHSDWKQATQQGTDYLHQLNGHFSVCRWDRSHIELTTDQLGIRNIFMYEGADFILFSTRIDWVKKLTPGGDIHWEKFGSRWLAINQFSNGSFLQNIQRLSQGGHAVITSERLTISNKRWTFTKQDVTPEEVQKSLSDFSTLALSHKRPLSIGLSGGMDSRTILATLMNYPDENWVLHTFGEKEHPDVKTAIALNDYCKRTHHILPPQKLKKNEIESLISDYIGQTMLTATPYNAISLQAYDKIKELNLAVIDGGLGEIGRRRYLVGLLLTSKKALIEQDMDRILPHFRYNRADIFNDEVHQMMECGFKEELLSEIEAMPDINEIGIENWVDLFSIRTRVLNTGGPEQSRSDGYFMSYMPFIQPEFIHQVLSVPVSDRKHAKLYRAIIKKNTPNLRKIPLIKGDYSYPYGMKDISSSVWLRIKAKLGIRYNSSLPAEFLLVMEDYVRDLYASKSAQEYSYYDHQKIQQLITGFYDEENTGYAHQLNWWLAFEVFRRS